MSMFLETIMLTNQGFVLYTYILFMLCCYPHLIVNTEEMSSTRKFLEKITIPLVYLMFQDTFAMSYIKYDFK